MPDLSQYGLGPYDGGGSTTGAIVPPTGNPTGTGPTAGASTPSPRRDPLAWIQVTLGVNIFPVVRGQGVARVKVKSSLKVDQQKAAGKDKATTKLAGREACPVSIELQCLEPYFESVLVPFLNAIDPNGVSGGGPFSIGHPDASRRQVKNVMVKNVGEIVWQSGGGIATCSVEAEEWIAPKPAAAGKGVSTPKEPTPDELFQMAWAKAQEDNRAAVAELAAKVANAQGGIGGGDTPNAGMP